MRSLLLCLAIVMVGCSQPVASSGEKPGIPPATPLPGAPVEPKPEPQPQPAVSNQTSKGSNDARLHQLADLKTVKVTFGRHTFKAWVMDNDSKRAEGMMFLTKSEVPANHGMLFVFPDEAERSFWMRNTLIDLDIAYMRKDGTVVSVSTMKALDETGIPSKRPAMYALEVLGGTFKRLGIQAGAKATIDPPVKAQD